MYTYNIVLVSDLEITKWPLLLISTLVCFLHELVPEEAVTLDSPLSGPSVN